MSIPVAETGPFVVISGRETEVRSSVNHYATDVETEREPDVNVDGAG